jgi:hypothetical protein
MRVDVDEPRSYSESARIDLFLARISDVIPDVRDSVSGNRDVHLATFCACAVKDGSTTYDKIVVAPSVNRGKSHRDSHSSTHETTAGQLTHLASSLIDG